MDIKDFLFSMIEKPLTDFDEDLFEIQKEYENKFGHAVPRQMLPDSLNNKELSIAIKKCIETSNDNIFEILGIKVNEDFLY